MTKVSVIVPNYNHARYLGERLKSILGQTRQDFELIVLDDQSTDDSLNILEQTLAGHDHRLHCNSKNSGSPFLQWAKGIELARGELIWIAESDDSADPRFLERLLPELEDPSVSLAFCQSTEINEDSQPIHSWKAWTDDLSESLWAKDFTVGGDFYNQHFMAIKNCVPNASAVIFRKDRCNTELLRNPPLKVATDWLFWTSIIKSGRIAFKAEPLNNFRRHPQSTRLSSRNRDVDLDEEISASHEVLITDRYCPEDALLRDHLVTTLIRFWSGWGFHLSSPRTWRRHPRGIALVLTILRHRRRLLSLVLEDGLTRLTGRRH